MSSKTETIVLSAFAANPNMTSETGIGWSFIRATALVARESGANVVVVMNLRSESPVQEQLEIEGLAGIVELRGIDMPPLLRRLKDPRLTRVEYVIWWFLAKRLMKSIEESQNVVLAHHVTFATEIFPTPITAFSAKVFKVWGPVGSAGDPAVYRVRPLARGIRREARMQALRDVLAAIPAKYFGSRSDLVLAQNDSVAAVFNRMGIPNRVFPNVILKPELQVAIENARQSRSQARERGEGITILSVGHLIPRKRIDLGIAAIGEPQLASSRYRIFGKPLEGVPDTLPQLARDLGVADRVVFEGKKPREEVLLAMANSDVLFHPSGREGASGVIGEATAVGIPIVCFDNTGASSVLIESGSNGIAIKASSGLTIAALADALVKAATLQRVPALMWTEERFIALARELLDEARSRATHF